MSSEPRPLSAYPKPPKRGHSLRRFKVSREQRIAMALEEYVAAPNGCWLWTGATQKGYASMYLPPKVVRVHRVALEVALGRPLKPGMFACHKCDNRLCIRAAHLFEGNNAENMADARRKGRAISIGVWGKANPQICADRLRRYWAARPDGWPKGEDQYHHKLTDAQIREIRASALSGAKLGRIYGVHQVTISKIKRGLLWKHV